MVRPKKLSINISEKIGKVSALLLWPEKPTYLLVLGHGAGASMIHPFMETLSLKLYEIGIATLRYNFPYMEKGSMRPDSPGIAHNTIVAVVDKAFEMANGLPLLAGGKSYGGRMTSQTAALYDLKEIQGLVFYGFPLHQAGKPGIERAQHLNEINQPMLFLQGTRDVLTDRDLIKKVSALLPESVLLFTEGGDHSFKMLKKSGVSDEEAIGDLAAKTKMWTEKL